jgi:hypothetical protein
MTFIVYLPGGRNIFAAIWVTMRRGTMRWL